MKRKLPRHAAPIGLAVGVFLIAVIGWVAVVSPQRSKATDLKDQVDQTQAQLLSLQLQPRPNATHKQVIKVADVFRLSKAIPNALKMPDILLELNGIAGASGITFASISPHPATVQTNYEVVPIDVVFRGNYYDLSDFLYRLRNLVEVHDGELQSTGRLFTVDKLSFAEGQVQFPQIEASLTIDAYVYGTPGVPVASGGTATTTTASTTSTSTTTTSSSSASAPAGASAAGVTP